MPRLYALVLSGGAGTRLWPLSRQGKPKQFLELTGNRTMLQDTVDRVAELIPSERIFVVALRDIRAGEELLYEYNLWDSDEASQDCFCGKAKCRGTMFSPAEVERREKLATKKQG